MVHAGQGHTGPMGFDPHRKQVRSPLDYVLVAACLVLVAALVAWALFG